MSPAAPDRCLLSFLGLLAFGAGCSQEHGPLSDKPDPTSLRNAGTLGQGGVSTAYGLTHTDQPPEATFKGTMEGTTRVGTAPVAGLSDDFGQDTAPRTSNLLNAWSSGPNLPVEAFNMALPERAGSEVPAEGPEKH